jgi:hypothetical protein
MDVFITIDTECTEERSTPFGVRPPIGYDVMMRGRFANQARGLGTDLLISELTRAGLPATFFLEALCAEYFGHDGLAVVVEQLLEAGQDIQLHLHPNFRRPAWRASGGEPLEDNIGAYPLEDQIRLLKDGISHLTHCGVPRERLCAFRAGNFGASNSTWNALAHADLCVSSSLNLAYRELDCLIVPDRPRIDVYQPVAGVWELPVSCFREAAGYRPLQLTAVTFAEMRHTLDRLERAGTSCATIVTHAFEFFIVDDERVPSGRPNRVNVGRLKRLLDYLSREHTRFNVRTVGWLGAQLKAGKFVVPARVFPIPSGSVRLRALRYAAQLVKRLEMRRRRKPNVGFRGSR